MASSPADRVRNSIRLVDVKIKLLRLRVDEMLAAAETPIPTDEEGQENEVPQVTASDLRDIADRLDALADRLD